MIKFILMFYKISLLIIFVVPTVFLGGSTMTVAQTQEDISVSVTITDTVTPVTPPTTGGGGGGLPDYGVSTLILEGTAYPGSLITILKDGAIIKTLSLDNSASFNITIAGLSSGSATISLFAEDTTGEKSITISYTITLLANATTTISGLNLPPTLSLSQTIIRHGDDITLYGQTFPESEVFVFVNSAEEVVKNTIASPSGLWVYDFDTNLVEVGNHLARAKSVFVGGQSVFSGIKSFEVVEVDAPLGVCVADLNNDGKVDIIDFSILLYNWDIPESRAADFNTDGRVDIIDFSIMLFYWGLCPV